MIHIYLIKAPLAGHDPARVHATATEVLAHISTVYRSLRGGWLTQEGDTLHISLRISSGDRWKISSMAKRMGTTVLQRCGINPGDCSIELVEALPSRRNLTAAQGRAGTSASAQQPEAAPDAPDVQHQFKGRRNATKRR